MSKKDGIELKLTYRTWNCMAPKKFKSLASVLKKSIRDTMLKGMFDCYSRELPAIVRAPFMEIDTTQQNPFVKVTLDSKKVKSHKIDYGPNSCRGIEVNYDGPIEVTICWRAKS